MTVYPSRVVVGSTTYPVATMVGAESLPIPPGRLGPVVLFLVGLLFFGIPSIAAIVWWFCQKPCYGVLISWGHGAEILCCFDQREKAERIVGQIKILIAQHPPDRSGASAAGAKVPRSSRKRLLLRNSTGSRGFFSRTIPAAVGLVIFDAWFIAQGFLSFLVICLGTPLLLIHAFRGRKDPPVLKRRLISAGILVSAAGVAIMLIRNDQRGARQRAEQLIVACESYNQLHGNYPEQLPDLVPRFIPEIPPARRLGFASQREFTYLSSQSQHTLIYTVLPPYGRQRYVFESQQWTFFD